MADSTLSTVDAALAKLKDTPKDADVAVDTVYASDRSWTQIAADHAKNGLTYSD